MLILGSWEISANETSGYLISARRPNPNSDELQIRLASSQERCCLTATKQWDPIAVYPAGQLIISEHY